MTHRLQVLVQTPAHSAIAGSLTYLSEQALPAGTLVRVPFGKRETLGVVWVPRAADESAAPTPEDSKLRAVTGALEGIEALSAHWQQLVTFAASYYQRSVGEVALAALPPQLRELNATQLARRMKRAGKVATSTSSTEVGPGDEAQTLSPEQASVLATFAQYDDAPAAPPFLLFGATGSGKTEMYLRAVERVLAADPAAQALVMVPEINLTPQLEARFRSRFATLCEQHGELAVVSMHSGMTPPQRLKAWLAAHTGAARIVLGTRLAVFASLQRLKLIVVDEEHDPSYKQSDGARYSARDLAVWRARQEGARVILGSATPSLETWHHSRAQAEGGRYLRLHMPSRIASPLAAEAALPKVVRVDMNHQPRKTVISPPLLKALQEHAARGEQSLVFLNRRGYAPVLACGSCEWKSECPHCSAYRVFHKIDRSIRCHHCGFTEPVPRACPECGNVDLQTVGRGTERLEEHLAELLAEVRRPGTESALHPQGLPLRIARIDADSTRLKGELEKQLARVHDGEVDVLVGTQMIAKGHDFRRITLVAAVNPDGALFSSDFRAPERLFGLLMQAAGRAGRDAALSGQSEMWLQTFYPKHPFFDALKRHDFPAFADQQLKERQSAGLPPFSFQALMRAEARTQEVAQRFLQAGQADAQTLPEAAYVTIYPAVPVGIQRVGNIERAQMLVESASRARLQAFLAAWHTVLHATRKGPSGKGLIRWAVDVDPMLI